MNKSRAKRRAYAWTVERPASAMFWACLHAARTLRAEADRVEAQKHYTRPHLVAEALRTLADDMAMHRTN